MNRFVRIGSGIFSLLLGSSGFIIPILPGWPLFAAGLILLSPDVPFLRKMKQKMEARFPKIAQRLEKHIGKVCDDCF